jgi:hypothetical protein
LLLGAAPATYQQCHRRKEKDDKPWMTIYLFFT